MIGAISSFFFTTLTITNSSLFENLTDQENGICNHRDCKTPEVAPALEPDDPIGQGASEGPRRVCLD